MDILGLVPARGGSKGIPCKNIIDLGGKPLLAWTSDVALSSSLKRVILSTDDREIADIGRQLGLEVPFLRPAALATDDARSIDVVLHALDALGVQPDAVMLLQPTTPFRTVADIEGSIGLLASDVDSVISVAAVGGHHPGRMKLVKDGWLVDPPFAERVEGQPRQTLAPLYIKNGAIYLTRSAVLRAGFFQGTRSRAWEMPSERSVNVDGHIDLVLARAIAEERMHLDDE